MLGYRPVGYMAVIAALGGKAALRRGVHLRRMPRHRRELLNVLVQLTSPFAPSLRAIIISLGRRNKYTTGNAGRRGRHAAPEEVTVRSPSVRGSSVRQQLATAGRLRIKG
ncbi:hypothetical protein ATK30_6263 [Amycolatopsis echigonensis]|uniref:Uncharacterized protein n=1 Tax=Amycolatopsis echigonensis TaxID=2576905 RepID=A0A2N3WNA1_9PSEU|nr:hypothetical protein ATK30_6263 [Amycolatopsis niigatensis]